VHYRTLFFSDIHLGSSGAQADAFLSFIKDKSFDKIYVVGDFVDFWSLKRKGKQWTQEHNDVLQKLLKKHRKGADCTWIVGNHDEFMSQFSGENFGGIDVMLQDVHVAADGKKYFIMHGHELDAIMLNAKWAMHLGSRAYDILLWLNPYMRKIFNLFGHKHFSLSAYVKYKVKGAVNFISDFEDGIAGYAKRHDVDGVICGHVHVPSMTKLDSVFYLNTGDWVESLSCIVEHASGKMELLKMHEGVMVSCAEINAHEEKVVYSRRELLTPNVGQTTK
jgi:UDP-2,3-diacylglucosamine pyrophosphatase LpxH